MTPASSAGRRACAALLVGSVLLLSSCDGTSAASRSAPPPSMADGQPASSTSATRGSTSVEPAGADADLASLLSVLERVHPEPFHGIEREEFVAALEAYEAALPSLSPEGAMVELMRVWALLSREGRDGHQFALPQAQHAGAVLPIRIYEFAEGVFVTAVAPGQDVSLVGSRIMAIGDTPIREVLGRIEPLVPRDGPATVPAFRPILLLSHDVLRGLEIVDDGPVRVTVERSGGGEASVRLNPIGAEDHANWAGLFGLHQLPLDPRVRYLASAEPFTAELLDRTAYLRYRSVQSVDVREARQWLDRDEADRLVLDLRQNPGGDNGTYGRLLRLVVDFAAAHPGAVTVLIDRVTFSAASNLATEIDRTTDARFVGEPMGGGLNFWNDVTWVDLDALPIPMRAAVSTRYWQFAAPDDPRLTIEPDVAVEVTAADLFAGRDPALEAAFAGG